MALLDDRPKAGRPVAATSPDTRARLRPVHERSAAPPAAWLLDVAAFRDEFAGLWDALGEPPAPDRRGAEAVHPGTDRLANGDSTSLRRRAAELWHSPDPVVAHAVSHLDVSAPEEWEGVVDERHLGHWFRLVMAAHLRPLATPVGVDELRAGLPNLGFSHAEARRATLGRELGDLAVELSPDGFGPAVNLSLGHGHKGWLGSADAAVLQARLAAVPPRAFRTEQQLVSPCEALWHLLGEVAGRDGVVLVLATA
jgi:hypothetical protein